jgi:energy-coupling factor transport system substrate-specific component
MRSLCKALVADRRFRFLLAGGFAAFVNWAVRFPLSLVMPFWAAVAVAMGIGMCVGFVIYRRYVFPGSSRRLWKQVRDFIAVNGVGIVVTLAVAVGLKQLLLPHALFEEVVLEALCHAAGIAAGAVANYFGHRDVTFRA